MSSHDLDSVIEEFREALRAYVNGDPEPAASFFSPRDDVTLANPVGPPRRGPDEVRSAALAAGASFLEGGDMRFAEVSSRFEEVSRFATPELGYLVQIERHEGRVSGRDDPIVIALQTTMVFRLEDGGTWKVVHRHADPILTARPVSTTVQP
jgi:ketosteroid isomerase-like protein